MVGSRRRHLAKAVSWRVVGSTDTMILGWIFTGNPLTGLKIGLTETVTKIWLYYMHERVWFRMDLEKYRLFRSARRRHLTKTVTWRIVGTIDTMILAWIISGDPTVGLKVGATEIVTKMTLYYIHEEIWHRSKFGLVEIKGSTDKKKDEIEEIFN